MPTMISGQRATAASQGILADGRKPDLVVDVKQLEGNAAPLLLFVKRAKGRKAVCINPEFSHFEDEPMPYWDAINNGGGYTAGATSLVVDNGSYFAANYVIKFPRTGEQARVTGVSSNTLTVTREFGETTKAALNDNEDIRIIGTAYAEGADAGTMKSTKKVKKTGYTQIFRNTFGGTGTEMASEMYWGKDRDQERGEQLIDHALSIEGAFLFGEQKEDTSGNTPVRATRGVIKHITTGTLAVGGFLSQSTLNGFVRDLNRYSSPQGRNAKWFFASAVLTGAINGFGEDVLRTVPRDTTFGIATREYKNVHGKLMLVEHRLLENSPNTAGAQSAVYGGYGIAIDPMSPKYRWLQGRDTKLRRGIHEDKTDGYQDEIMTECGLQFFHEKWNRLMTGVTG